MTDRFTFPSFDGVELSWQEVGAGRPVVLLHGLFSTGDTNWTKFGQAKQLADAGFRVILPDLRGHGQSGAPHDAAAYPPDVLAMDAAALVAHLGLTDYDLGGYSLGGRTTMRCLVRGMTPRRAVVAGMGLTGIIEIGKRTDWFLNVIANADSFERGSNGWTAVQFMRTNKVDGEAVAHVLRSQIVTTAAEVAAVQTPVLVLCGAEDQDNGSAPDLADALPHGTYVEMPGTHMSAVVGPAMGAAILEYLSA
ncbi:alpha/beta fold hydrolase [Glacieibacterium frigidum]|uniref:Alpha/beta hydrolase n=1 Tax=Glacieibacterium frigidum TaxID=2593303 RepID=A0A552UJ16_9SPHN|nr:alpha/beta fold hydrolase [Glacieibacterium frigidum]TRW18226.1 alpha/beta hydrolase [Glacieibacterium frigidum]